MDVSQVPVSARARSRLATRKRLLDSGRNLFAVRGLHKVTTHDIAHGAGVAAGTFYLHFPDKEALFREIAYDGIDRLRDRLQEAMDSADDIKSAVRAHAEALITFAEAESDLVGMLFGRDHGAAELESEILDYSASTLAGALLQRRSEGTLPQELDPEVTAQAMTGMLSRTVAWWIEDPTRAPRESVIRTIIGIQLGGTYTD
ncbi:MAG: TetR/AcrR family transcriptional regulator [Candidatus Binatia bacterium]